MKKPQSQPQRTFVRLPRRFQPMAVRYLLDGYPDQPLECDGFAFRCPACRAGPQASACTTCGGTGELGLADPRVRLAPGQKPPREARA